MTNNCDDSAIVYCESAFNTPNGKTAHGLVRFTNRYRILSVIDNSYAGQDAGKVLDGTKINIPIFGSLDEAYQAGKSIVDIINYFIIGLAPDGGRLSLKALSAVKRAIKLGLNVVSGLHDFLSEDKEIALLAAKNNVSIHDVRKPPDRKELHFFSGKIEKVKALKVAVLGTDSAVGKRTTAWKLIQALHKFGFSAEMIGTGQTAWMQGARYGIILDSLINDFVTGEIEHAVWSAWKDKKPDVIVIEGQGSLMNPAYPGGFEILAAGRPDLIILQHAPERLDYDGFPGYPIQPLPMQIEAIELLSGKPVVAITLNHENISHDDIMYYMNIIQKTLKIPVYDVFMDEGYKLGKLIASKINKKTEREKNET
jgi:uncharacterized NAD-dependent epimerase/dehydratase family protein